MAITFEQFCDQTRQILKSNDGNDAREQVSQLLEDLLQNQDFVAANCAPDREAGFEEIYQDPETDFRVLLHTYNAGRTSPPHDHGSSWAVYGLAVGYTDITMWKFTGEETESGEKTVEPVDKYRMHPPQTGVFHPGDIHSIHFTEGARVVRVTGTDLKAAGQASYAVKPGVDAPEASAVGLPEIRPAPLGQERR